MSAGVTASRLLRAGSALLAAIALLAAAEPASASGPEPPTAAQVRERTESFLTRGDHRSSPVARAAGGSGGAGEPPPAPAPPGARLLPDNLLVALYGAPQLGATAVGKRSPRGAARLLKRQARPYKRRSDRPVVRSINLIGVIATASRGPDGKYRSRQPDEIIARYLRVARSVGARLTLDIQPGRSPVLKELRALRSWIAEPDVDIGIDPEWNVGRRGVPGRTEGSITAEKLNKAARWLNRLVAAKDLPQKALIVHQFRRGSIKRRRKLRQRPGVAVTLNFDGIGSAAAKRAGYADLARKRHFDGFSLFYARDIGLMRPRSVLRLKPEVDYVMYQ
jgi:hypothetical protein